MDFNDAIQSLVKLDPVGDTTWANWTGPMHRRSRIDKVFDNLEWVLRWPRVTTKLLYGNTSDHVVLYIELVAS